MTIRSATIPVLGEALPVEIELRGGISDTDIEHLLDRLERVVRPVADRLIDAQALLTVRHDRDPGTQARVRVTLRAKGETIRAEVYAASIAEAVTDVDARLHKQLEQRVRTARSDPRGREHEPGEWRHGNMRSASSHRFERPAEEREVVVKKSPTTLRATPEEARWDRFMLDYDFFLFVDAETERDFLLTIVKPDGTDEAPERIVDVEDAPTRTLNEARAWLDQTGDDYHFYADAETGRGAVIYRRYDGHYGLLTPRDDDDS